MRAMTDRLAEGLGLAEFSKKGSTNAASAAAAVGLHLNTVPPPAVCNAEIGLHASKATVVAQKEKHAIHRQARRDVAAARREASHFVLYLSQQTWRGEPGGKLAAEVRNARAAGLPIVMVHENDMSGDGCDFATFFQTTPGDLIANGLYKALALASYPAPFDHVSSCLVAYALGAKERKTPALVRSLSELTEKRSLSRRQRTLKQLATAEVLPTSTGTRMDNKV